MPATILQIEIKCDVPGCGYGTYGDMNFIRSANWDLLIFSNGKPSLEPLTSFSPSHLLIPSLSTFVCKHCCHSGDWEKLLHRGE